jgi:hypothetical protein
MKESVRSSIEKEKTTIQMSNINNTYIKNTTGFPSKIALVAFIIIVSNGEIATTMKTITNTTWLEEWYMHCAFVWGRSVR